MSYLKVIIMLLISAGISLAQFTTPGTGVQWTLDSLAARAPAVVSGSAPNYRVSALVTISSNDKVTIGPGTTVLFSGSTSGFDVNGVFAAVGTDSNRINFSSLTQDSLGAYNGITFNDTSIDSLCKIKYCNIFFAYYGLRCIGAAPRFEQNVLFKCRRGVQLSSSSPYIARNTISRSYEYGITMTLGSSPVVEYNDIFNNNTQNTSPKNQITVGTQGENSPIIRHNKIHGSVNTKTGGIAISSLLGGASSAAIIANNDIYQNSFGMTLSGSAITCMVTENLIHDNTINPDFNSAGSGINVNGTASNTPHISKNVIARNLWGVTIQNGTTIQPGPGPNLGNAIIVPVQEQGGNIFINNGHSDVIYDVYNNCTNDIFAHNNDWGVYDSAGIEQHVFHKVDNNQLGTVKFVPFSHIIPVELLSFTAEQSEAGIIVSWATATELNAMDFLLFRQIDEQEEVLLSTIRANGTTNEPHSYRFLDEDAGGMCVRYRLVQRDFDGASRVLASKEVALKRDVIQFRLSQNYPNPFNPSTAINYVIGGTEPLPVRLVVYDILGVEVHTVDFGLLAPGTYTHQLDAREARFASGMYVYALEAGKNILSKKLVVEK